MPKVQGYDPQTQRMRLVDIFTGQVDELLLSQHSYFHLTKFAENQLQGLLQNISVWMR